MIGDDDVDDDDDYVIGFMYGFTPRCIHRFIHRSYVDPDTDAYIEDNE